MKKISIILIVLVCLGAACTPAQGELTIEEFVSGATFHGTNGLKVGSEGNLYIASVLGGEILILDSTTGEVLNRYDSDDGVVGPDDVVFGPDGSLYWTDILSGEVGRRAPDGTVSKQLVAPFVNPIAFNEEGRLFVAQAFLGDGLYELDPELLEAPRQILGTGDPSQHLNGFDFGPDGYLYAPRQQLGQIVRIDIDTAEVEILVDSFEGAVAFNSSGELYVAADFMVYKVDMDTGDFESIIETAAGLDNLAFDAADNIYLTNFRDGSVSRLNTDGTLDEIVAGGMIAPGGIATISDADGVETIYVADFWTVRSFDTTDGSPGPVGMDFFFDSPFTANADDSNLVLTSWFGNTVELWNPVSQTILGFGEYNVPMNAIAFQGEIVVAELGTGSLVSSVLGEPPITLSDGFMVPAGLAASEDDLWVGDFATGMIYQVVKDDLVLDTPQVVFEGLTTPEGMILDEDGTLLVVESMLGQLTRIDLTNGEMTVVADGLMTGIPAAPDWPPTWYFSDVDVGDDGSIYVTGDVGNVLYKISWQ